MSSEELLYTKGCKVWLSHPQKVWQSGTLLDNYKKKKKSLTVEVEDGAVIEIGIKDGSHLPYLRNPAVLIGQNDLTTLSYLHEPGVLYNLKVRFCERQIIYTYCGIVLVAINPYADLPLYGSSIIRTYRGRSMGELEPHIFALAEESYNRLEREECDLSIIVSGESGAGKTVSAKYVMRYFAAVGGSELETQIERKVVASSPIMEAFGNAKTIRNDNSSRFGKFIKLFFKNHMNIMHLSGATIHTYLLEKSRVIHQAKNERNYHIFYQLCSTRKNYPHLMLDEPNKFHYLNTENPSDMQKLYDKERLKETLQSMLLLGFDHHQISDIFKVLAGILHLGNIRFNNAYKKNGAELDVDACDVHTDDLNLQIMSELLSIDSSKLRQWLIMRQIESVNDQILIPNNIEVAKTARDALAKHIYAKLFQYIVSIINNGLNNDRKRCYFIGVLDIYGFETFDVNSFEQFCINYANEKLQQQFNQHVFKLEQEEYLKEGISWTMIDFHDNQPCIDLIEAKLGVLDLLDEECRMPRGSDESWVCKLVERCSKFDHFQRPRFDKQSFLIKHFSDSVIYSVNGFLEKNRDNVSKELVNVIRQSQMSLCKQLMELEDIDTLEADSYKIHTLRGRVVISPRRKKDTIQIETDSKSALPNKQHRRSVGSQFRDSLSSLIATLHTTVPHYVRCIKPNEQKLPFKWDTAKVVQQLRACGVLETIRISAAGFPSRWAYKDFFMRYQLLGHTSQISKANINVSCQNIIKKWIPDNDKYRLGKTQIFFRAGQVAYLEQIRANLRRKYVTIIQANVRCYMCRKRYLSLKRTALGIQRYGRGLLARKKIQTIRERKAATIIGKHIRGWLVRIRYRRLRHTICGIQQYARGMLARKRFCEALDHHRAIQIQRFVRGCLARREFMKKRHNIIICQAAVRRFLAKRKFKVMKAEAKSISHMQKIYKGLENKIITMQQRIDDLHQDNTKLKQKNSEISVLKMKLEMKKSLENELKKLKLMVKEKDEKVVHLLNQLRNEQDEKMMLLEDVSQKEEEFRCQKEIWMSENDLLKKQLDALLEEAKHIKDMESPKEQTHHLMSEIENNEIHEAYRNAIKEKEIIENENSLLKEELSRLSNAIAKTDTLCSINLHSRTDSIASSQNDEDIGYSSTRNMSDVKQNSIIPINMNNSQHMSEFCCNTKQTSSPKSDHTTIILKLRNLLEAEKCKYSDLRSQLDKAIRSQKPSEDALRVSELEVENEKLRHDYELLRESILHGAEKRELDAQHIALEEELKRRRDECIQLKAVLQQQTQSLKSFNPECVHNILESNNSLIDHELMDAFNAQKLVNRQLESELRALTEENNAHFADLTRQIDDLRNENEQLQNLLQGDIDDTFNIKDPETLQQSNRYLKHELKKTMLQYSLVQEELNAFLKKFEAMKHRSDCLTMKLQQQGITENGNTLPNQDDKQNNKTYQGLMKFRREDIGKICQRLIVDMNTRVAISLVPGFSAYILFMCIRYTDDINEERDVCDLFSRFLNHVKNVLRNSHVTEYRILWLVNSITLFNLLKQYGDVPEYSRYNTEEQKKQQLKNFNLLEYRRVILELITKLYDVLVQQMESTLEAYIVPAILDNDEINSRHQYTLRSHINVNRHTDNNFADGSKLVSWKKLIAHLEHFYKQFEHLGLDICYSEQIFHQIMYFICAVAMNCLMLRGDICMWETGMIIRYNLGYIEDWVRAKKMANNVLSPLTPLNEVSQLLQSRKSEKDVDSICELCENLNSAQVLKVIKSYKLDDYEGEITNTFIEMLTKKLNDRPRNESRDFTMDQKFVHPFKVVYRHSDIKLEEIELPKYLNLDELLIRI